MHLTNTGTCESDQDKEKLLVLIIFGRRYRDKQVVDFARGSGDGLTEHSGALPTQHTALANAQPSTVIAKLFKIAVAGPAVQGSRELAFANILPRIHFLRVDGL